MINIPTEAKAENTEANTETVSNGTEAAIRKPVIDSKGRAYGTGRRKNSSARVWIKPGTGKVTINKQDGAEYLKRPVLKMIIDQPFGETDSEGKFDVIATVKGGGLSGQAGAITLGIARALVAYNPETYHKTLRKNGFLTRDSRKVERKKYGLAKARRSFQFSKR